MFDQIRFLFPFAIPFLMYALVLTIFLFLPEDFFSDISSLSYFFPVSIFAYLLVFFLILLLMPVLIQKMWLCHPLSGPLRFRLAAFCKKANFEYNDLKIWGALKNTMAAAIIGVHPKFRYVLFSARLLRSIPPQQLEAIVCHEIGHHHHRHLLFFPFILAGMVFAGMGASYLVTYAFDFLIGIENYSQQEYFYLFLIVLSYAFAAGIYFRFIFGFYSRLFERQADLHIFAIGVNPLHLIGALRAFALDSGEDPQTPDWHHYSIQQRIDFIEKANLQNNLIAKHHRYVHTMLYIYFGCFFSLCYYFF